MKHCLTILALLFTGCSSSPTVIETRSFQKLAEATFELREILRISDEATLNSATSLAVTADNLMLIGDSRSLHVHVYTPDGRHLQSMGGGGKGPGEFERLGWLQLFEDDSLLISDNLLHRVSIFARSGDSWTFARSFPFKRNTDDGYSVMNYLKPDGINGYLTSLSAPISTGDPESERQNWIYRLVDEAGTVLDSTVAQYAPPEAVVQRNSGVLSYTQRPFGSRGIVRFKTGGSHYVAPSTEQLHIVEYTIMGDSVGGLYISIEPRPILPEHYPYAFETEAQQERMLPYLPESHPAFTSFQMSEKGNYWVNLGQVDLNMDAWAIFSKDAEHLGSIHLPKSVDVMKFHSGKLFTIHSSIESPEIVVYDGINY